MEALDRSQWQPQSWAQPTSAHYRSYQDPTSTQRSWLPTLPPPPQPPHQQTYYNDSSSHGGYHNYHRSSIGNGQEGYYSGSTASASPTSQQLTPPTPHQTLLSHSESSNFMGFLDDMNNTSYPHPARGGDHWHQSRYISQHHHTQHSSTHQLHGTNGAIPSSDYPPLCTPQIANRSVQGLTYPKIEYPEVELDTKDHLYHYPSPTPGSNHSSASTAPSPPYSIASRPPQAPSMRRRSQSHSESGSGTASPLDGSTLLNRNPTSPQKRMNHIMSEQRRRNAIREGYQTLITLLAPEDGGPMIEMPTRGRPKGSSAKNKNRKRGKSGILFRAVEFTNWLEDGNQALRDEVKRLERMEASSGLG